MYIFTNTTTICIEIIRKCLSRSELQVRLEIIIGRGWEKGHHFITYYVRLCNITTILLPVTLKWQKLRQLPTLSPPNPSPPVFLPRVPRLQDNLPSLCVPLLHRRYWRRRRERARYARVHSHARRNSRQVLWERLRGEKREKGDREGFEGTTWRVMRNLIFYPSPLPPTPAGHYVQPCESPLHPRRNGNERYDSRDQQGEHPKAHGTPREGIREGREHIQVADLIPCQGQLEGTQDEQAVLFIMLYFIRWNRNIYMISSTTLTWNPPFLTTSQAS